MASSEETGGGAVGARHRPGSGPHHSFDAPSAWVLRFAGLIPAQGGAGIFDDCKSLKMKQAGNRIFGAAR